MIALLNAYPFALTGMAVLFGLCLGSFVTALIHRVPKGTGWVLGRSACPRCAQTLRWNDLIPLVSWVLLKGRCRYCRTAVEPLYPMVEVLTALGAVIIVRTFGFEGRTLMALGALPFAEAFFAVLFAYRRIAAWPAGILCVVMIFNSVLNWSS